MLFRSAGRDLVERRVRTLLVEWVVSLRRRWAALHRALVAQVTPARSEELIQKATNWLDKSVEAVGGRDRLLQLKGFQTEARLEAEQAPPVDEVVQWSIDGTARRKRTVLGTVVETDLTDKAWVESSGDRKTQLTPTEARWQLSEIERHPLAILSAYVRGTLKFRLLADRVLDGRNYLVLEATGERFDRLRLAIDRQSGLIRTVELNSEFMTRPIGMTWRSDRGLSIFGSLMRLDQKGNPQPEMAQSMTSPDQGKTWVPFVR